MALQAEIDDSQYQESNELLINITVEEIKSTSQTQFKEIKEAATTFKTAIEIYKDEMQDYDNSVIQLEKDLQLIEQQQGEEQIREYVTQYCTKKQYLAQKMRRTDIGQKIYQALFTFQDELNAFIGQEIQLAYVFIGTYKYSHPKIYINISDLSKFLTYEMKDNETKEIEARFRENQKVLNYLKNNIDAIGPDNSQGGLEELNAAHRSALVTFDRYNNGSSSCILWINSYPPPKWGKVILSNRGAINEGYARAVFQRQIQYFVGMDYNSRLEFFMLNYVYPSDNAAGGIIGDIGIGNLQIAVKGVGAATITIGQMEKLANQVLQNDFDKSKLKKIIQEELESSHSLLSFEEEYTVKMAEENIRQICDNIGATCNW